MGRPRAPKTGRDGPPGRFETIPEHHCRGALDIFGWNAAPQDIHFNAPLPVRSARGRPLFT